MHCKASKQIKVCLRSQEELMSKFVLRRAAGALGAEFSGLDLAQDLPDEIISEIRRALVEHQVIFFREQELTPAQQVAFGARFGPLNIHPFVKGMDNYPEVMEIIKEPEDRIGVPACLLDFTDRNGA